MATYEEEREIEPESTQTPNMLERTIALKNIEQIQMCLYAALAATEAAVRVILTHPS